MIIIMKMLMKMLVCSVQIISRLDSHRISALGHLRTDLTALGSHCRDLGQIFSHKTLALD